MVKDVKIHVRVYGTIEFNFRKGFNSYFNFDSFVERFNHENA